jgi:hypothetical protein
MKKQQIKPRSLSQRKNRQKKDSESMIQSSILTMLNRLGILNNRVNGGAIRLKNTKNQYRMFRCNSLNGKADIECWLALRSPTFTLGITVYLEVKRDREKQSPSQLEFERLMKKTGQHYFVVHSITDAINVFCNLKESIEANMAGYTLDIANLEKKRG